MTVIMKNINTIKEITNFCWFEREWKDPFMVYSFSKNIHKSVINIPPEKLLPPRTTIHK
jgi:hypothetical protein